MWGSTGARLARALSSGKGLPPASNTHARGPWRDYFLPRGGPGKEHSRRIGARGGADKGEGSIGRFDRKRARAGRSEAGYPASTQTDGRAVRPALAAASLASTSDRIASMLRRSSMLGWTPTTSCECSLDTHTLQEEGSRLTSKHGGRNLSLQAWRRLSTETVGDEAGETLRKALLLVKLTNGLPPRRQHDSVVMMYPPRNIARWERGCRGQ